MSSSTRNVIEPSLTGLTTHSDQNTGMLPNNIGILLASLDIHAIVSIANTNGLITEVNDHFCRISGYSRSELIGSSHHVVKSAEHDANFYEELWRTISSGSVWSGDICNRSKDGRLYWVATTIIPFVDKGGLPES